MGNWTDRFDPETVDEIKRCEVGEGDFLLAERLAMHKGVESVFGFHVNCLGLGKPYWEKGVYLGDVLDFFDRHSETLIEKRAGSWHGDSTEVAKASECLQKGLAQFGLTLAQARERYGKREKARYRKWAETVAFFATDCSFLDIANLVDRSVAQVVHEIHDTWYEDYMSDFESKEEAVAAAREFIKEHKNAVNDQKHGIGSVTYWTAEVTRCIEDEDFGWLPCDADGATEDGHGLVPADATAEYICTLDGSREERAFQRAKYSYYDFLDYKDDCYTTVSGYMN